MKSLYRPELLWVDGGFVAGGELLVDERGTVEEIRLVPGGGGDSTHVSESRHGGTGFGVVEMPGKALLPGFVNAHSHSFQRLIRGKAESRAASGRDFWSWRGTMYHAASSLDPEQVYDVARMAFLEMVLAGTTTVGEFHYVHNAPDGRAYEDPNLLAKQVIRAANSVGLRMVLLRTAYLRAGYELPADAGQRRFYETGRAFIENMDALVGEIPKSEGVSFGVAPHSLRAVPVRELREIAEWTRANNLPLHMHVAEQIAENEACLREYGLAPVALLAKERLLGSDFTAVHAVHVSGEEIALLAGAGVTVCSCPTTERNLGDGIFRADDAMSAGVRVAFGSDSQAQIDPLEDARELEYHLRLKRQERAVLDPGGSRTLAARLFECATLSGARSLGVESGDLRVGSSADFFTVDLKDVSIAGNRAEDLLAMIVFGMNRTAVRDVVVNGRMIVRDQVHPLQAEIIERYTQVHESVWGRRQAGALSRGLDSCNSVRPHD
jgi:formimidoylglutamate deiminase